MHSYQFYYLPTISQLEIKYDRAFDILFETRDIEKYFRMLKEYKFLSSFKHLFKDSLKMG